MKMGVEVQTNVVWLLSFQSPRVFFFFSLSFAVKFFLLPITVVSILSLTTRRLFVYLFFSNKYA